MWRTHWRTVELRNTPVNPGVFRFFAKHFGAKIIFSVTLCITFLTPKNVLLFFLFGAISYMLRGNTMGVSKKWCSIECKKLAFCIIHNFHDAIMVLGVIPGELRGHISRVIGTALYPAPAHVPSESLLSIRSIFKFSDIIRMCWEMLSD